MIDSIKTITNQWHLEKTTNMTLLCFSVKEMILEPMKFVSEQSLPYSLKKSKLGTECRRKNLHKYGQNKWKEELLGTADIAGPITPVGLEAIAVATSSRIQSIYPIPPRAEDNLDL